MNYLIGSDECGYGSLFYSLVCCAVRAPEDWKIDGLKDSKQLTKKRRSCLRDQLIQETEKGNITYHITERTNKQIDEFGCYVMLKDAHIEVIKALYQPGDKIIVDGNLKFIDLGVDEYNIQSVIKADQTIPIVSAASIIGKVCRDNMLIELSKQYPLYDLDNSFGYPSPKHLSALKKYGITPLHRLSYRPMKEMIKKE